jgi:hypothetical protein
MRWHRENQQYLVDRRPVATVGVVWSQRNTDFFGRDNADEVVDQPWRGFTHALVRGRIPFVPVHVDHVERESANLSVLILPNLGAVSDAQAAAIREFVRRGGALIATGQSTLFDEWGDARADYALADLFGVHAPAPASRAPRPTTQHTYLRLTPELRAQVDGPRCGDEPLVTPADVRHPILAGFEETDLLPFGGTLAPLAVDPAARVLLTYVPPFPTFPPESAWMREPRTTIPGLIVNGRVAFLPADLDRRYALDNLPDHGDVLANLVRWAAAGNLPLEVRGRGLVDWRLYRQATRLVLHLVNLTSAGTWRPPVDELIRVGPLSVKVRVPADLRPKAAKLLVAGKAAEVRVAEGWAEVEVASVTDHEVVVIE